MRHWTKIITEIELNWPARQGLIVVRHNIYKHMYHVFFNLSLPFVLGILKSVTDLIEDVAHCTCPDHLSRLQWRPPWYPRHQVPGVEKPRAFLFSFWCYRCSISWSCHSSRATAGQWHSVHGSLPWNKTEWMETVYNLPWTIRKRCLVVMMGKSFLKLFQVNTSGSNNISKAPNGAQHVTQVAWCCRHPLGPVVNQRVKAQVEDINGNACDQGLGFLQTDTRQFSFCANLPCIGLGDTLFHVSEISTWSSAYQSSQGTPVRNLLKKHRWLNASSFSIHDWWKIDNPFYWPGHLQFTLTNYLEYVPRNIHMVVLCISWATGNCPPVCGRHLLASGDTNN